MKDILFVVLPGTLLLDLAGPAEAWRLANQQLQQRGRPAAYRLRFVGACGSATTSVGAALAELEPLPSPLQPDTLVLLLGQASGSESPLLRPLPRTWSDTRRWLARVVAPALQAGQAQLMTVCAGALLAADAGLLAQRQCTTHHELLRELQRLAPTAVVQAHRIFVIDGPVASSAGVTAGIDLALHLIALDQGDALAAAVAQVMVVYQRRGPQDPQLSPLLAGRNHLQAAIHRVQDAVCEQPGTAWSLQTMASLAHVTPRHLSRLFQTHVGSSPRVYVEAVRASLARQALGAGHGPKRALALVGIGGPRQWRRIRQRQHGHSAPDALPDAP